MTHHNQWFRASLRDSRLQEATDYTHLADLLMAQRWQEADQETTALILRIAGRTDAGWLRVEDIRQFPCSMLMTLDHLWAQASGGAFGFEVQRQLWQEVGGSQNPDWQTWQRFGERVGWLENGQWTVPRLILTVDPPLGHLPVSKAIIAGSGWFRIGAFFSRVGLCGGVESGGVGSGE